MDISSNTSQVELSPSIPTPRTYRQFVFWPSARNDENTLEVQVNAEMALLLDCHFIPEATSDLITTSAGVYLINYPGYLSLRGKCKEPARLQTRKILHSNNVIPYYSGAPTIVIALHDIHVTCSVKQKSTGAVIETLYHNNENPDDTPVRYKNEDDFDSEEAFNKYLERESLDSKIFAMLQHG